jgi:rhamnulokinase
MGLWLLQESLRVWARAGLPADLPSLLEAAAALAPGGPVIDPDDPAFLPPGPMVERVQRACEAAGAPVPTERPAVVRCVLDGLAAAFARAVDDAAALSGRDVDVVHLVGGGARNALLCQLTADACGRPVLAGPVEATALGSVLVQARAHGTLRGALEDLRDLVRRTADLVRYEPSAAPAPGSKGRSQVLR